MYEFIWEKKLEGISIARNKFEKSLSIPSTVRMAMLLYLHKIPSLENVFHELTNILQQLDYKEHSCEKNPCLVLNNITCLLAFCSHSCNKAFST